MTLSPDNRNPEYYEKYRLRAPDAGRILWAMGKLRWRNRELVQAAERVILKDLDCPWNRPRYMTTALWGVAWSCQNVGLPKLCEAVQQLPDTFWEGAHLHRGRVNDNCHIP